MKNLKALLIVCICLNVVLFTVLGSLALNRYKQARPERGADARSGEKQIDEKQSKADTAKTEPQNAAADSSSGATIKSLLQNAVMPMGKTMYVYGGGWNKEDTGAGTEAVTIGLSPEWSKFADMQSSGYDSSKYRYQIEKGLDCTGYIGWVIYNTLETENNKNGYVFFSRELGARLAAMGLGETTSRGRFSDYKAGDILSSDSDKHAWIAIGKCSDGSVVFAHSSPPGVSLCGTAAPNGGKNSEAAALAEKYMKKFFPHWYSRFPKCVKGASYLNNYDRFRWNDNTLTDPEGYANMTPEEILEDIF